MNNKSRIIILAVLAAALTAGYIFWDLGPNWDYALPRRVIKSSPSSWLVVQLLFQQ